MSMIHFLVDRTHVYDRRYLISKIISRQRSNLRTFQQVMG